MFDRLVPEEFEDDGEEFLSPREVLRRLRREFRILQVDKKRGHEFIEGSIKHLEKLKSKGHVDGERSNRLYAIAQQAHYIYFADQEKPGLSYLTTILAPQRAALFRIHHG